MSIGKKLLMFALAATFVAAEAPTVQAAPARKPPLCTAGRFAVSGAPLLGPGGEVRRPGEQEPRHRDALSRPARQAEAPEEGNVGPDHLPQGRLQRRQRQGQDHRAHLRRLLPVDRNAPDQGAASRRVHRGDLGVRRRGRRPGRRRGMRRQRDRLPDRRGLQRRTCQCQPTRADKSSPIEITADGREARRRQHGYRHRLLLPDRRRQAPDQAPGGGGRARSRARSRRW